MVLVAAPASASPSVTVQPTQALAIVLTTHTARSAPGEHSTAVATVAAHGPLTGEQTILPVLGSRRGADSTVWLHVRLPGRPNGHTGWIKKGHTITASTSWHIVVDTPRREVIAYQHGRAVQTFRAVVGKSATPTPTGEFFIEESVSLHTGDAGAPFALALSARSNVFQEFEGGPGQIALHGVANIGGALGSAASHGCVRLSTDAIRWLAARVGPGAPVTIRG